MMPAFPPATPSSTKTTKDALPSLESGAGLIEILLKEQQQLTAVDRFSQNRIRAKRGTDNLYQDLIPLESPGAGQQFAFEVDLDQCTGCKACVAACHSMNGLDETESWRSVGLMTGSEPDRPYQQNVTTACHHCVDPGCLNGCPVQAYDKDPVTGIVHHLDDQCIGCQYCIWTCPYEVPQYNKSMGIVRKCNMCTDRLSVGEAPACVQGCPNEAIRIRIVEKEPIIMASRDRNSQKALVPGAPDSALTCPTTNYLSKHPGSQNALPADAHIPTPQPSHLPLVVMLVLTQASVGLVAGAAIFNSFNSGLERGTNYFSALLVAWLIAGAGLTSSFFHLGQPLRAWRAFLGLRTSWLSREIVLFGGYMMILTAALSLSLLSVYSETAEKFSSPLIWTAAICGVIAVFSSAMIYVKTGRDGWRASVTFPKFFLTTASFLVVGLLLFEPSSPGPLISLIALGMFGLATESSENLSRMLFLTLGAIAIPGGLFISGAQSSGILIPAFALAAILILSGELLGRYFFFTTVNFARMPGHSGLVAVERPFRPGHFSK